mgnify:FL=1
MPPTVDPTSGVPIMDHSNQIPHANSMPQPQSVQNQTPQQMHQNSLQNMMPSHQTQPQMMNTAYGAQMVYPHMQKSKLVMLMLAIFLGWAGGHNFYLGFTNKAVAQLLISILSFGLLAPISSIWALIEGVTLFSNNYPMDANGIPLKD